MKPLSMVLVVVDLTKCVDRFVGTKAEDTMVVVSLLASLVRVDN